MNAVEKEKKLKEIDEALKDAKYCEHYIASMPCMMRLVKEYRKFIEAQRVDEE
jgi:hypothetical protein